MAKAPDIATKAIADLGLSPPVAAALTDIREQLADAYRDRFIEMTEALKRQASALDRIQQTLHLIVKHLNVRLEGEVPAVLRVAETGEAPDLASAVLVADPIGMGFTLSQADLAKALAIPQPDVSVLCKAFKLADEASYAIVVRSGKKKIVNFHPRAVERFRTLVGDPPSPVTDDAKSALKRVKKRWKSA